MIKPIEALAMFIIGVGCGVIVATVVFTCVTHKPGIHYVQNTEYRKAIKVNIDGRLTTLEYKVRFP